VIINKFCLKKIAVSGCVVKYAVRKKGMSGESGRNFVSCSAFQRADQVDVEGVKIPMSSLADLSCRWIINLNFATIGVFYNNGFQKLKRIRKYLCKISVFCLFSWLYEAQSPSKQIVIALLRPISSLLNVHLLQVP